MPLRDEVALVIDDDLMQLEIMADDLQQLGVKRVLLAQSGRQAIDLVNEHKSITIIFTDISMPEMDGLQLLRQLATEGVSIPIVLVSSAKTDIMHSVGMLARSHGMQVIGFVQKPVTPENLLAMLHGNTNTRRQDTRGSSQTIDLSPGRLKAAIAAREIFPWYQPQVEAQHLRLTGVEALARWKLADGRFINPGQFIPAIEANGLADELFFSILQQILMDVRHWQASGILIRVSINLSLDCAYRLDLPDRIQASFKQAGVAHDSVVIEVTESRLMENSPAAIETLTRLSLLGFLLSIDDFGTGYSSLVQVANLPFGELKLDLGFVQEVGRSAKADAILRSTITLGRSLGMEVVAEGVETSDQLDRLRAMGAELMQGYLFGRPMPAKQLEAWLAAWRPGRIDKPGCARPFTLMIVDDDRATRLVIENMMKQRMPDAQIVTAMNGQEAIKLAQDLIIDAATLDFHMPGMNGLELLIKLRNMFPAARYSLLTADALEANAQEATRLGALYCLKPLTVHQADRIVNHCHGPR